MSRREVKDWMKDFSPFPERAQRVANEPKKFETKTDIPFDFRRRTILQGDVALIPVEHFRDLNVTQLGVEVTGQGSDLALVVAHSETGHHHVVPANKAVVYQVVDDPSLMVLEVIEDTQISHLREEHRHEPQFVPAGYWRVQRQVNAMQSEAESRVWTD